MTQKRDDYHHGDLRNALVASAVRLIEASGPGAFSLREAAREVGVPAYVIFADRTLIDMAEKQPATLDEMLLVHGVGDRKLARYGDAFLDALREALR